MKDHLKNEDIEKQIESNSSVEQLRGKNAKQYDLHKSNLKYSMNKNIFVLHFK